MSEDAQSGEIAKIEARMAEIKEQTLEELIRDWPSPWRNEAMTNAKLTGRLGGNREYQDLLQRTRALKGQLSVQSSSRNTEFEESEDPMGAYSIRLAKEGPEKAAGK